MPDLAGQAGRAINALNRLDAEVAAPSHSLGGWTMTEKAPGADRSDIRADGFTWWSYEQAQDITATLRSASDVAQGVSIRIATEGVACR